MQWKIRITELKWVDIEAEIAKLGRAENLSRITVCRAMARIPIFVTLVLASDYPW